MPYSIDSNPLILIYFHPITIFYCNERMDPEREQRHNSNIVHWEKAVGQVFGGLVSKC